MKTKKPVTHRNLPLPAALLFLLSAKDKSFAAHYRSSRAYGGCEINKSSLTEGGNETWKTACGAEFWTVLDVKVKSGPDLFSICTYRVPFNAFTRVNQCVVFLGFLPDDWFRTERQAAIKTYGIDSNFKRENKTRVTQSLVFVFCLFVVLFFYQPKLCLTDVCFLYDPI